MITSAQDYFAKLHLVLDQNPPVYATLPNADNIYNVDTNTRIINAPEFLSIEKDHKSETIYFIIDRYVDYFDLAQSNCLITYTNAQGKSFAYIVPFYDIYTFAKEKKMVFPWCIDASVAAAAGVVKFAISFFKTGEIINSDGIAEKTIIYTLNTLPATSKIPKGMEIQELNSNYLLQPGEFQILMDEINNLKVMNDIYWTVLK